jgi:hypothetical protein
VSKVEPNRVAAEQTLHGFLQIGLVPAGAPALPGEALP